MIHFFCDSHSFRMKYELINEDPRIKVHVVNYFLLLHHLDLKIISTIYLQVIHTRYHIWVAEMHSNSCKIII